MPFAVASQISPSGMTLAGKYGIGIISIGSMSTEGLTALPTQWGFAESAAKKHGTTVDRKNWRVLLNWHIAETREKAREEAKHGLMRWHNEYIHGTLQRPGAGAFTSPDEAVDKMAFGRGSAAVIGTPDDLVTMIKERGRPERRLRHRASASCTTGPTPRTRSAAGTWSRATSSPRSTAT